MKINKDQFDALLIRLITVPPQEAKSVRGATGDIKPKVSHTPRHRSRIEHRVNTEHRPQGGIESAIFSPSFRSHLGLPLVLPSTWWLPILSPSLSRSTGRCAPGRRCRPSWFASAGLPR